MSNQHDNYRPYSFRLNTDYPDEAKLAAKLDEMIEADKKQNGRDGGLRRLIPLMVEAYINQSMKVKPLTPERRLERLLMQTMESLETRLIENILETIATMRPGLLTRIDQGEPTRDDSDSDVINGAFLDALTSEFEGNG